MKGGSLIKEARLRAGLTQQELAERLSTSQSVIARWESNRRSPTFETVVRAIRACGLELEFSMGAIDEQDRLQIIDNLRYTPTQRLAMNRNMLELARQLRRAKRVQPSA